MYSNIYYTLRQGLKIVVFKIEITAPIHIDASRRLPVNGYKKGKVVIRCLWFYCNLNCIQGTSFKHINSKENDFLWIGTHSFSRRKGAL